jgi:hypothetical protein
LTTVELQRIEAALAENTVAGERYPPAGMAIVNAESIAERVSEGRRSLAVVMGGGRRQPVLAVRRWARNVPMAASAWFEAASLPTPDTKPCGMPSQTSTLASTPASTARAT